MGAADEDSDYEQSAVNKEHNIPLKTQIITQIGKQLQNFRHTLREFRRRKLSYALGLLSCFLVVCMVAITDTALAQVPILFLKLAEIDNGEYDLRLSNEEFSPGTTLNYTHIAELAASSTDASKLSLSAPRLEFGVTLWAGKTCISGFDPFSLQWLYNATITCRNYGDYCAPYYCPTATSATLQIIDTAKERDMGFGRAWDLPKLAPGYIYLRKAVARTLNVTAGDTVVLGVVTYPYFAGVFFATGILSDTSTSINSNIHIPLTVASVFSDAAGKSADSQQDLVVMEYDSFLPYLATYAPTTWKTAAAAAAAAAASNTTTTTTALQPLASVRLFDYARYVYFNVKERIIEYNDNSYDVIQTRISSFASSVLYNMGYNQLATDFPLLRYMRSTRYFALFVGLIISLIIVILTVLSVILIYSLLMINVETRTFELGVLRMVGMTRAGLVQLILMQSFCYAVPAWILGLLLGQAAYIGVAYLLQSFLEVPISLYLTNRAVLLATALGLLIPVLSSILPITNALGQNLHDSLDTSRSKTKAVKFSIERSEDGSVSWVVIVVGVSLFIFGFAVYYIFPLALLTLNISLLLYMFFALLLAMLFGLIMLALNLENIFEHAATLLFFFWENPAIRNLIRKNLVAHRPRNRKTTIMYALSLGFIIFIAVSFDLQIRSFEFEKLQQYGTTINIDANSDTQGLNTPSLLRALENYVTHDQRVLGYTYFSFQMQDVAANVDAVDISNVGQFKTARQKIRAIGPNFFNVTLSQFYSIDYSTDSTVSLDTQLYTVKGSSSLLIGSLYRSYLYLNNFTSPFVARFTKNTENLPKYFYRLLQPLAFVISVPAMKVSQFPSTTEQETMVSFASFVRLSNGSLTSVSQVPIKTFFIRVKQEVAQSEVEKMKTDLRQLISPYPVTLYDVYDALTSTRLANSVMNFFFIFSTFVAMFMCFFSLTSSMYTNIYEQSKEIGVLRAIGVRKFPMRRLYVYESFVLVITASLLGFLMGTLIAYTMTLQRALFTQLPVEFVFPWQLLLVVFGCALLFSVLSSLAPVWKLTNEPIVTVLKRLMT